MLGGAAAGAVASSGRLMPNYEVRTMRLFAHCVRDFWQYLNTVVVERTSLAEAIREEMRDRGEWNEKWSLTHAK